MKQEWDCEERLRCRLLVRLEMEGQAQDERIQEMIDEEIVEESRRSCFPLEERLALRRRLFNSLRRLDVIQELLDDETVTEIMVNGPDSIFVERAGKLFKWEKSFSSREKLEDVIQQIVSRVNRTVNEASPIVDARLEDGSRVNVVLRAAAIDGPAVTIRKFGKEAFSLAYLVKLGTITEEAAGFLKECVRCRKNIFVSGGTGSGKTTFLNALSAWIPGDERIITIEDSAELKLQNLENLVRLEARRSSGEGEQEITVRDLIKTALRMRPSRIIVGEVRDGACLDMLQAMNTGHDGSLSTGHANSARDMMARIETMIQFGNLSLSPEAMRSQIASAIDIVVHLSRLRDRTRRVVEIAETCGVRDGQVSLHTIYAFREEGEEDGIIQGSWEKTGILQKTQKLAAAGIPEAKSPSPP